MEDNQVILDGSLPDGRYKLCPLEEKTAGADVKSLPDPVSPHPLLLAPIKFNVAAYQTYLQTKLLGRCLLYRTITETTMDDAKIESEKGVSGTVVLAETQLKGQGRKGRTWISEPKGNLYFTFFVYLSSFELAASLNLSVALAICKTCHQFGVKAGLKWPNDVLVGGKKICGMLVNSWSVGKDIVANIGVGVNINEDMKSNPDKEIQAIATSVSSELGAKVNRERFLATFFNILETDLLPLSFAQLLSDYSKYDLLKDKSIVVAPKRREDPSDNYKAKAVGFSKEGHLIVELDNGTRKELLSEEVTIRTE